MFFFVLCLMFIDPRRSMGIDDTHGSVFPKQIQTTTENKCMFHRALWHVDPGPKAVWVKVEVKAVPRKSKTIKRRVP